MSWLLKRGEHEGVEIRLLREVESGTRRVHIPQPGEGDATQAVGCNFSGHRAWRHQPCLGRHVDEASSFDNIIRTSSRPDHQRITLCIYRNEVADVTDCYERPQALEYGQREGRRHACSSMPPPESTSCYSIRSGGPLLPRVVCNVQIQCIPSHLRKPQSHTSDE